MRSISKLFLLFQLFFLASLTGAFQTGSKIVAGSTNYERRKTSGNLVQSASFVKRSSSMVVLDAKKKVSANEEEERVKKSPLELVLVYMVSVNFKRGLLNVFVSKIISTSQFFFIK